VLSVDLVELLSGGDYDSFAEISNAVAYVSDQGIEFGRQTLGAAFVWVPRLIWPDKPLSTSSLVAENMGYTFLNVSSPLWGELLVDFGAVGLVVGFVLLGWIFARWDDRQVESYKRGGYASIAATVLPFYFLIILRGSLLSS